MLMTILKTFYALAKYPLWACAILAGFWILMVILNIMFELLDGRRLKRGYHNPPKKTSLIRQLFLEAPRAYVKDIFDTHPDFFKHQGLVIYTGRQGQGKTVSMVRDIMQMQYEYPLSKCITNFAYKHEDVALTDWRQLIDYKNGIYGVIVGIDEIQNWFSSKQSKDFPPEMFEVVTQNRKNRRIIVATTQNFYQPAKDIRAQCSEVRKCITFFGVFTVVHAVRPVLDSNGDVKEWKHVRFYSFVHTKEIREAYDTYKVIESLAKSGFKERVPSGGDTNIYIVDSKGKKRAGK